MIKKEEKEELRETDKILNLCLLHDLKCPEINIIAHSVRP